MKFYPNKFFISFLILIMLCGFSIKVAKAGGGGGGDPVASIIVDVIIPEIISSTFADVSVFNTINNYVLGTIEVAIGGATGASWLSDDGKCRLGNVSGQVAKTYADECGGGLSQDGEGQDTGQGAGQSVAGSPILQSQTTTPTLSSDGNCTTGFTLNYNVTDAYQYGIYRDGNLIKSGTLNQYIQPSPYNTTFSYTDDNLAPNINYKYEVILSDKNGQQYRYPEILAYTDCIKLDLKANDSDGPLNIFVARDNVNLRWETVAAASCAASGDWSGDKGPASASQDLGRIARGTSNPGQGKQYNYSMSCEFPQKNKTLSDSVQVTVFKYPDCTFSADPSTIEVLPATSTLSWDCRYVGGEADEGSDSCSIDQSVGNVNSIFGSANVRPSQATTYTLTCSTIDGTSSYQTSVNIGFKPRVYEVIPR